MPHADIHALLAAAADQPDDDTPRLALANWLDEGGNAERAELIRIQCALAQLRPYEPEYEPLARREKELLEQHGDAWRAGAPEEWYVSFERGFGCVEMKWHELTQPPGQEWWSRHAEWVMGVSPLECDDDAIRRILPQLQGRPGLRLWSGALTDNCLPTLASLTQLRHLSLRGRLLTDRGLAVVTGLNSLRELRLSAFRGSAATSGPSRAFAEGGIRELSAMTELRRLVLVDTGMTDANWLDLARLSHLQELTVNASLTNGVGMGALVDLPDLRVLDLSHSPIADAGVEELKDFRKLRVLNLQQSLVTDKGVAALAGLHQLEELVLGRNRKITDAALIHVGRLTGLRYLSLRLTGVTDDGLSRLAGAGPRTETILRAVAREEALAASAGGTCGGSG